MVTGHLAAQAADAKQQLLQLLLGTAVSTFERLVLVMCGHVAAQAADVKQQLL